MYFSIDKWDWNKSQLVKRKMTGALVLVLLDFKKPFEFNYDASIVGIRGVLSHDGLPIAFFDLEFYVIVQIWSIGDTTLCKMSLL